jgi:hypothetical protein
MIVFDIIFSLDEKHELGKSRFEKVIKPVFLDLVTKPDAKSELKKLLNLEINQNNNLAKGLILNQKI